MSHYIEPFDHYVAGDSLKWEFTVEDGNGNPVDISGAGFDWFLLSEKGDAESQALLDESNSGISVDIVDGSAGRVNVEIAPDVTSSYGGRELWHRLVAEDGSTAQRTWAGPFPVHEQ